MDVHAPIYAVLQPVFRRLTPHLPNLIGRSATTLIRRGIAIFLVLASPTWVQAAVVETDAGATHEGPTLFAENFDDGDLNSRGWYDGGSDPTFIDQSAIRFTWDAGDITPDGRTVMRRLFTATDSLFIRYYVRYSSTWVGSGRPYQPHFIYLLTDQAGEYSGLSRTNLTAYIEPNALAMRFAIQDALNIDTANIDVDLTSLTENRAVAGCNGTLGDPGDGGDCYAWGGSWYNGRSWITADAMTDADKTAWHKVEVYLKMNSVVDGIGIADGVAKIWVDDTAFLDTSTVSFRTGQNATMKWNQFVIAPYMGDGSPVAQSMWVDALTVAQGITSTDTTPPLITPQVDGTLGANGWYVSPVELSWQLSDPESGIASTTGCDALTLSTSTPGSTLTCTATNGAGLTASASASVKIDLAPPAVNLNLPADGARYTQNSVVNADFACSDGLSGLATCDGTTASGVPIDTASVGTKRFTVTATDLAGNTTTVTHTYQVVGDPSSDTTPPIITPRLSGTRGSNGWYLSAVTVNWDVSDPESNIVSTRGCDEILVSRNTRRQTVTCSAWNGARLWSYASVAVKIDLDPPAISLRRPASGASYVQGSLVMAMYYCSDALSGIASCEGTVPRGMPIDTGSVGSKTFTVTARDRAGRTTTVTHTYNVTAGPFNSTRVRAFRHGAHHHR